MRRSLHTVLPVAEHSDGECLIAADGAPVWPLGSEDNWAAVERVATVFGGQLQRVPARKGTARHLSKEAVVALGADADSAALLYAHLTQRRFRTALNLDTLKQSECPSIVVTTPEHLSIELLDWLYNRSGRSAPGIICGDAGARLRRQVLVRAAAATLCGPLNIIRSDVFPTTSIAAIRKPGFEILGSEASASERHLAVARGAGVLTIMTHCDGVDAFMGADLTLCGMEQMPNDISDSEAPWCRLTGFCHRHNIPVSQVIGSATLFPPEEIAARVFVWDVCWGVMPVGSWVDPRWGIGVRLMDSAAIGAILTTWQIVMSSPEHANRLSRMIAAGVPIGVAVARFNASRESRMRHHRMCLLGDPRVQLPVVPVQQPPPARPKRSQIRQPTDSEQIKQLALLRLSMADAKQRTSHGPRAMFAAKALEAVEAFETAVSKGVPVAALHPQLGNNMRSAVLDYALSRGKLLENWMPFMRSCRAKAPRPCPVCNRKADTLEAIMRPPGVYPRRLVICALCGVVEDAPTGSSMRIELASRHIHLHGILPQERWATGVVIGSSYPTDSVQMIWPATSEGTLAPSVELPETWPAGPLRISTVIVWDTTFAVLSLGARDSKTGGTFNIEAVLEK